MELYVDIQGFLNKKFIPKEMTITTDGEMYFNYLFKSSVPFMKLSQAERREVIWLEKKHHCLRYSDGYIDPGEIGKILTKFDFDVVYVKGHQKKLFIEKFVSCEIIDLHDEENAPKFEITEHNCPNHMNNFSICSYVNVKNLYKSMRT